MNKLGITALSAAVCAATVSFGADDGVSRAEFDALKDRLESIEATNDGHTSDDAWYDNIEIAVGMTGVLQGSSGAGNLSADGDITDASGSVDIELMAPVGDSGTFYVLMESGSGDGLDGDIATLSGLNDDGDDDSNLRVTEAWYEQTFNDIFRVRVGKVDLTTDFDTNAVANSETDQFLSSGFINNLAVEFPDDNGFGGMLWISPSELVDVGIGVADADADWDNAFENLFVIAEVDFKPVFGELQGNYRIFGWYNGKDHDDLTSSSTDEQNLGFGVSFDQQLNDIFTAFARASWQRGEVSQVEVAWSAGFSVSGSVFGRDDDTLGFACGMAMIGSDWEDMDAADGIDSGDEGHLEVFYNYAVNDHVVVSPDVQFVTNANGDSDSDNFAVFGLRTQISF